ncbi:MAG: multidrug transporter AcrB, partial [Deltaproteobacteria bacterium CG_4_10_14_3_um_filter_60_8]
MKEIGISGVIAKAFIKSKLTPLLVMASLLLGLFAVLVTSREEEPQIVVPMIDVMVAFPGASAEEVEARVTKPMEKYLWEIPGVEYVYSIVKPGMNLTVVRFFVGENMEKSQVNLYSKLLSHFDLIPPGASPPLVKPKSIDDVPILTLTLWDVKENLASYELRRLAMEVADELKKDNNVSEFSVIGGQPRQVTITLEPARLQAYNTSALQIMGALQKANVVLPAGNFSANNQEFVVETGGFFEDLEAVGSLVVGVANGHPVHLKDLASLTDGPAEPASYVFMGLGPATLGQDGKTAAPQREAVTIAVS